MLAASRPLSSLFFIPILKIIKHLFLLSAANFRRKPCRMIDLCQTQHTNIPLCAAKCTLSMADGYRPLEY